MAPPRAATGFFILGAAACSAADPGPPPPMFEHPSSAPMTARDTGAAPPARTVACPTGASWNGTACAADRVVCPDGSTFTAGECIATRVVCPEGTEWLGDACFPKESAHSSPKRHPTLTADQCSLKVNSIPSARVSIDGKPAGTTPRFDLVVQAGQHVVTFVSMDEKSRKSVTTSCRAGDTSTVLVRMSDD